MTISINKNIFNHFGTSEKLTVCVNKVAEYMNLFNVKQILPSVNFSKEDCVLIKIDEHELFSEDLTNEKMFVLLALYAMGVEE